MNNTTNLKSIRDYLKTINKPALKTIKSPDGDLIDCVLFHLQPAFDHPLLKGQETMTGPPQFPEGLSRDNVNDSLEEYSQVWRMSGESCPENTIPIRRITEEDVLRAGSVQAFIGRKQDQDGYNHSYAMGTTYGTYYGVDASFSVWKPFVKKGELSISQMWIMAGNRDDGNLNSLETGYLVGYPDAEARLFVYWTNDSYKQSGSYNLECSGFVQTSRKIGLGSALLPATRYGQIYDIRLRVQKSPTDGNWWLIYGDEPVGYWPSRLFPLLNNNQGAERLEFGGEVVSIEGSPARSKYLPTTMYNSAEDDTDNNHAI